MGQRHVSKIVIGEFVGPPKYSSAGGLGLRRILEEELRGLGVKPVRSGADLAVQGKYRLGDSDDRNRVIIEATFVGGNGQVLADLHGEVQPAGDSELETAGPVTIEGGVARVEVDADEDSPSGHGILGALLGATVDLGPPAKRDPENTANRIIRSLEQPAVFVQGGTRLLASRQSPFSLEILVRGQAQPVTLENGLPFVRLGKGETFEVRLRNGASFTVAAILTLDGINSFAFSQVRHERGPQAGQPRYARWIIPPGQTFDIKGWHRNNREVDRFLVTDFGNSEAAKMNSLANVGAVTVTFAATWIPGREQPPLGEPMVPMAAPPMGIGRGGRASQVVEEERNPRTYGPTRAVLTVRYDKPEESPVAP
jgi:hypothetical protein